MLKYLKAEVRINEFQTTTIDVGAWELPIVQAVHSNSTIEVVEEHFVPRPAPETQTEYERLQRRYGRTENEDGSKGPFYVDLVYGNGIGGMRALAQAIKDAVATVPEAANNAATGVTI